MRGSPYKKLSCPAHRYVLSLARFDTDYDVRDRARMIEGVLVNEDEESEGEYPSSRNRP